MRAGWRRGARATSTPAPARSTGAPPSRARPMSTAAVRSTGEPGRAAGFGRAAARRTPPDGGHPGGQDASHTARATRVFRQGGWRWMPTPAKTRRPPTASSPNGDTLGRTHAGGVAARRAHAGPVSPPTPAPARDRRGGVWGDQPGGGRPPGAGCGSIGRGRAAGGGSPRHDRSPIAARAISAIPHRRARAISAAPIGGTRHQRSRVALGTGSESSRGATSPGRCMGGSAWRGTTAGDGVREYRAGPGGRGRGRRCDEDRRGLGARLCALLYGL
ncbi:hypothetical protein HNP84_000786 [Thermocatellispora tengchongensis]|uniref:Uncharacterized protein n=1 Tax=Thermocatellispora tengchongensis TaxID=1073253 RepID=A0A840P0U7_9ACTN|nr:hypothetical protein [Thermocatellispora tengchongensis]